MNITKYKHCKIHNYVLHVMSSDGRYRCRPCRVDAVQKRRLKIKQQAIEYLGGKCKICGYSKYIGSLEFHHRIPENKEFQISASMSWNTILKELNKCDLLCANCHREEHEKLRLNMVREPSGCRQSADNR